MKQVVRLLIKKIAKKKIYRQPHFFGPKRAAGFSFAPNKYWCATKIYQQNRFLKQSNNGKLTNNWQLLFNLHKDTLQIKTWHEGILTTSVEIRQRLVVFPTMTVEKRHNHELSHWYLSNFILMDSFTYLRPILMNTLVSKNSLTLKK